MRVLYHLPLSAFSRKIRLVLAERRLPFELKLEKPWEARPEYLEMNPAGTVPTLVEENGLVIPDSNVICEYLEEAYPDTALMGRTLAERVEVRRLIAWFDGRFAQEVTRNLIGEKYIKRMAKRGQPDAMALRAGYANLKAHMGYLGWLAENRKWLARALGFAAVGLACDAFPKLGSFSVHDLTDRWFKPLLALLFLPALIWFLSLIHI